jgi:glycosyltransferase involved in cell wall biosynthesis
MKVTVGVPTYNNSATVGRVLDAVLTQSRKPDEVILVDDGSRDGSGAEGLVRGVRVISHSRNLGLAEARNTVLQNAVGDIVVFFDADAVPDRHCLRTMMRHFKDPEVAAVGGRGLEACRSNRFQKWRARNTPQDHGIRMIDNDWMVMGLCVAFRKCAVEQVGGFDGSFHRAGEDVDISLRIRQAGFRLVYEPMATVQHLPGGGLMDITVQAYKHTMFATYALKKNGVASKDYLSDAYTHLARTSWNDLRSGRIVDGGVGMLNMAARTWGVVVGTTRAHVEITRGPRPQPPTII